MPNNSLSSIQDTVDMSLWVVRAPLPEIDIQDYVTGAEMDWVNWEPVESADDGEVADYADEQDASDGCSEPPLDVADIDPEALLRYHMPGIVVESNYRSTVYAFTNTRYEELRNNQLAQGGGPMYPFASVEEYEVVEFIRKSGLSYDNIKKFLELCVVSPTNNT